MNNHSRKILPVIFICFFALALNAQKVKVKKNQVFLDGDAVANLTTSEDFFTYTDIKNDKKLNVAYKVLVISETYSKEWLVISDEQSRESQIPMKHLSAIGILNIKKSITRLLVEEYKLITTKGIVGLEEFFDVKRKDLTQIYTAEYDELETKHIASNENLNARYSEFKIQENGDIHEASSDRRLGRIAFYGTEVKSGKENSKSVFMLADAEDKIIMRFDKATFGGYKVFTVGGEELKFIANSYTNDNKMPLYSEVIKFVISSNYDNALEFGVTDYMERRKEAGNNQYGIEKDKSVNLYDKKGYVIDNKGEKLEGSLTMEFVKIKNSAEQSNEGKNILSLGGGDTKYGKEVQVKFKNKKGKTRTKKFKSKKGVLVVVINDDGSETTYESLSVNTSAGSIIGNSAGISVNYSGFYEVVFKGDKAFIFKESSTGNFGINILKSKKGFVFNNAGKSKRAAKLSKYLKGCKDVPSDILELDYSDVSSAKKLLNYYNDSCK